MTQQNVRPNRDWLSIFGRATKRNFHTAVNCLGLLVAVAEFVRYVWHESAIAALLDVFVISSVFLVLACLLFLLIENNRANNHRLLASDRAVSRAERERDKAIAERDGALAQLNELNLAEDSISSHFARIALAETEFTKLATDFLIETIQQESNARPFTMVTP